MTRLPGLDPEVLADLRLREASERDPSRSSSVTCSCGHHVRAHHAITGRCDQCECDEFERSSGVAWSRPVIAERWPCTGCNTLVDVTSEAIEMHAMFSHQLERRGDRPLAKRIPCAACKAHENALEAERRRPHEQTEFSTTNAAERLWQTTKGRTQ